MSSGRDDLGSSYHNEERERRLASLIQVARVVESDPKKGLKVQYGDGSTGYLPQAKLRSKGKRTWDRHVPGEQVVVFAPSGELGNAFVWGSVAYDDPDTKAEDASKDGSKKSTNTKDLKDKNNLDVTEWPDGTIHTYDHEKQEHTFRLSENAKSTILCKQGKVYQDKDMIQHTMNNNASTTITKDKITHVVGGTASNQDGDTPTGPSSVDGSSGGITTIVKDLITHVVGGSNGGVTTIAKDLIKHVVQGEAFTQITPDQVLHQAQGAFTKVTPETILHSVGGHSFSLDGSSGVMNLAASIINLNPTT